MDEEEGALLVARVICETEPARRPEQSAHGVAKTNHKHLELVAILNCQK